MSDLQEHDQEPIVHVRVAHRIENRQENEPQGARNREEDRKNGAGFVKPALVRHQLTGVSQPPFGDEGEIQEYNRYYTSGDEQRFEALCANIGDVPIQPRLVSDRTQIIDNAIRNCLSFFHARIYRRALYRPTPQHCK